MNPFALFRLVKRSGYKFIFWEIYWTIRFISPKKLINFIRIFYQDKYTKPQHVTGFPVKLTIDLTGNCLLHCPLCPTGQGDKSRSRGEMAPENFYRLIDEISGYLFEVDLFNWGEPFLNKNVFNFVSYCHRKNIKTRISSNLNFFPEGYEQEIVKSKLHHLVVSLDGITQESYGQYRVGGSIELVKSAVRRIRAEKIKKRSLFPFITWQFIIMRQNEQEVEEARRLANPWGFDRIVFQKARTDMGLDLFETDREKTEKYSGWIPKESSETNYNLKDKSRKWRPPTCHFLWNQSVVNWNGSVSPCCLYYDEKYDFGNAFQNDFMKVWNNKKYGEARRLVKEGNSSDKELICWNCLKNGFPE